MEDKHVETEQKPMGVRKEQEYKEGALVEGTEGHEKKLQEV